MQMITVLHGYGLANDSGLPWVCRKYSRYVVSLDLTKISIFVQKYFFSGGYDISHRARWLPVHTNHRGSLCTMQNTCNSRNSRPSRPKADHIHNADQAAFIIVGAAVTSEPTEVSGNSRTEWSHTKAYKWPNDYSFTWGWEGGLAKWLLHFIRGGPGWGLLGSSPNLKNGFDKNKWSVRVESLQGRGLKLLIQVFPEILLL